MYVTNRTDYLNTGDMYCVCMDVTELTLDRNTSVPKSVLCLFSGKGSGASIWNWASISLVLPDNMKVR